MVKAKDDRGNVSDPTSLDFRVDTIGPETLVKLPELNSVVESPVNLVGTCLDNLGVRGVELALQDIDQKKFWNGRRWAATESTFFIRAAEEKWRTSVEVPAGRYRVSIRALDNAGNYDQTPAVTEFEVK